MWYGSPHRSALKKNVDNSHQCFQVILHAGAPFMNIPSVFKTSWLPKSTPFNSASIDLLVVSWEIQKWSTKTPTKNVGDSSLKIQVCFVIGFSSNETTFWTGLFCEVYHQDGTDPGQFICTAGCPIMPSD